MKTIPDSVSDSADPMQPLVDAVAANAEDASNLPRSPLITEVVLPGKAPIPVEEADALPVAPQVEIVGESIFWDDDEYFVEELVCGPVRIRLRELSDPTLFWVGQLGERLEEKTEGRVTPEIVAVLMNGLEYADETLKAQLQKVPRSDSEIFKVEFQEMLNKVLCEGIVNWVDPTPYARECTDENKVKLGKKIRYAATARIMAISGFGDREARFH